MNANERELRLFNGCGRGDDLKMIGFTVMFSSFAVGLCIWMLGIRPYLVRRGVTVITGANWGVSAWSDWQQCAEFARKNHDAKASRLAAAFILTQVLFVGGLIGLVCGI
jgi:hypothetical protein